MGIYKSPVLCVFEMESSQPVQLTNILSEDYQHFELIHDKHPNEAGAVFSRMDDLRTALRVFKEATIGASVKNECDELDVVDKNTTEIVAVDEQPTAEPDVAALAILGSAEGSVDQEISITAAVGVVVG